MSSVISVLIYALEAMFVLGVVGSLVVLVLTTIEDTEILFDREKKPETERAPVNATLGTAPATHTKHTTRDSARPRAAPPRRARGVEAGIGERLRGPGRQGPRITLRGRPDTQVAEGKAARLSRRRTRVGLQAVNPRTVLTPPPPRVPKTRDPLWARAMDAVLCFAWRLPWSWRR